MTMVHRIHPIVLCGTSLFSAAFASGLAGQPGWSIVRLSPHAPDLGHRLAALAPALIITEQEFRNTLSHVTPPLTSPLLIINSTAQAAILICQRHVLLDSLASLRSLVDEVIVR